MCGSLGGERGYSRKRGNVGKVEKKGIEGMVNFSGMGRKDWEWRVGGR